MSTTNVSFLRRPCLSLSCCITATPAAENVDHHLGVDVVVVVVVATNLVYWFGLASFTLPYCVVCVCVCIYIFIYVHSNVSMCSGHSAWDHCRIQSDLNLMATIKITFHNSFFPTFTIFTILQHHCFSQFATHKHTNIHETQPPHSTSHQMERISFSLMEYIRQ